MAPSSIKETPFRFRMPTTRSPYDTHFLFSLLLAVPEDDMVAYPNFDDDHKVAQYIQDRRVVGVRT